jgi:hypothetical protein
MVKFRLAPIGRTSGMFPGSNCASNPNCSPAVTQKPLQFRARRHYELRPSKLRSSGASRWTRHSLEITVMPLQSLSVFKHRTLSLHPCCVCVCMWQSFYLTSVGKNNWFTVHEGCPITNTKFWKDQTFSTLQNSTYDTILRHFRFTQEAESKHISSWG